MTTLAWIVLFGILMSCIALVGSVTLVLKQKTLDRILLPLVAFAAGSLIGGALFHMIPASVHQLNNSVALYRTFRTSAAHFGGICELEQRGQWP